MRNLQRYTLPLIFLCQTTSAHDLNERQNVPYNFYAEPFMAVNHFDEQAGCSGYARAGYIRSSIGSPETLSVSGSARSISL
jgi:hypothetical protein